MAFWSLNEQMAQQYVRVAPDPPRDPVEVPDQEGSKILDINNDLT